MTVNITVLDQNHVLALDEATQATIDSADAAKVMGEGVYPNVARLGGALQQDTATREVAENYFRSQERVWKGKREAVGKSTALPNPWSSAKSIVLGAIDYGIPLLDSDGNPVGKTDMQKLLKAAKAGPAAEGEGEEGGEASDLDKALSVVETLAKIVRKLGAADQATVKDRVSKIWE